VTFPSVGGGVKEGVFANETIGREYYEREEDNRREEGVEQKYRNYGIVL
jgi:hypothetical protein